ncbi:MAG TPA: DUF1318 domain-containing protein, partial [Candidatus Hydrogenedentes bacterium]|nr:DUF1318 domain-containing protein [Candidatus Hydrogenedentota bacterium]
PAMKRVLIATAVTGLILSVGCVIRTEHQITAHVTLDIRHIEKQADAVLDYMEGKTDVIPELAAPGAAPSSHLRGVLEWAAPIRPAYAEELKTESARYRQILKKINERSGKINELKVQGCLGETNRGYLALRDCAALQDAEKKNEIQKLMAEENDDRKAFYSEVARLNSDNKKVTVGYVERVYAGKRLERAESGHVFQLPPANQDEPAAYTFEAFKATPLGQRLGAVCVADAWVIIP